MPIYVYRCLVKRHGEFDVSMSSYPDEVPKTAPCPVCNEDSAYIIKPIATAIIEGGTGARSAG